MSLKQLKANMLLLLTAAIWGTAFVAQKVGATHLGAYSFNGIRFMLGAVSLIPIIIVMHKKSNSTKLEIGKTIKAGVFAGSVLFFASSLQQLGMSDTTAGKAGFITGLYMVIVPVFGIFLKQRTSKNTWIGILLAVIGLYLLSVNDNFTMEKGDFLVFISSFLWAIHILLIDYFTKDVNPIHLSFIQFLTCSIMSIIVATGSETITLSGIQYASTAILYGGIMSVGVAYTLQAVAQKDAKPSHAAILLSMESVFGCLGGIVFLGERLSGRGIVGCILIFVAIIVSQMKLKDKKEI